MALATTLNTLTRALSSSLGIAMIATIVQIQSQVHSVQLTMSRQQTTSSVASLSFVLALQDAFLLLTVVTVLALIAVFFIRERCKQLS
jgi:hypothetical protein